MAFSSVTATPSPAAKIMAEDVHAASKKLERRRPATPDPLSGSFSWQQASQIQAGVLRNGQPASRTTGQGDQTKAAPLFLFAHGQLLVARRQPLPLGQQPDLVAMDPSRVRGVELAVADAGASGHALSQRKSEKKQTT